MKKLVLSISMFLIAATTFAQSEVVTDSIPPISLDGYKNFNGFMLDMGSMIVRSEERRVGKECRSRWSPYH